MNENSTEEIPYEDLLTLFYYAFRGVWCLDDGSLLYSINPVAVSESF